MLFSMADLLNAPTEIEFDAGAGDGPKIYKLNKAPTKGQEARYSRWLEKRVRDDVARALAEMPPEQAEQYAAGARRDIAAGLYSWGTPASLQSLQTREGQIYIIYVMLSDEHPEMDLETTERMFETKQKEMIEELTRRVEDGDPKVLEALQGIAGMFMPPNTTGAPSSRSATRRSAGSRKTSKKPRKSR